jgi:hypothetical protein
MPSLEELFCSGDDFCQIFEPQWQRQRGIMSFNEKELRVVYRLISDKKR